MVSRSAARSDGEIEFSCPNLPAGDYCSVDYPDTVFYAVTGYSDSGTWSLHTDLYFSQGPGAGDVIDDSFGASRPNRDIKGVGLIGYYQTSPSIPAIQNSGGSAHSFTAYADYSGSLG